MNESERQRREEKRQDEHNRETRARETGRGDGSMAGQRGKEQYERNNPKKGKCFITTACCEWSGLPDNCKELRILRSFRDRYMLQEKEGQIDLEEYYKIAPKIIESISATDNQDYVYGELFKKIKTAVVLIEKGDDEAAYLLYKEMISGVKDRYLK